ncbi:uncharacterized protein LOC113236648 [Hyposmocoma kahamanoa]|uniref:uncharacterized protein LOC113236648 n=1 Tax=Hyposmocoma kahamanoa TaxID=1477025 RepID=UPI000E6D6027|nr:uncharacterized protein LOC113236648 [Hyposmocoma kahamanoa]
MNLVHRNANHPFVVWSACILWLISILAIIWSVTLFLVIGDLLYMTGTDIVNADVLLSGIILLPTSMQMLHVIGYNKKIETYTKVACCPLWICLMWSVIINFCGIVLCFQKIAIGRCVCESSIRTSMKLYRVAPKHKRFIDSLQWYMRCCGLKSYRDWFSEDWYDKVRDYEWDPENKELSRARTKQMDSVPLR